MAPFILELGSALPRPAGKGQAHGSLAVPRPDIGIPAQSKRRDFLMVFVWLIPGCTVPRGR